MKAKKTSTPSLIAEAIIGISKIFLTVLVLNNLIWTVVYLRSNTPHNRDSHIEINQTGRDINQKIENR